MKHPQTKFNVDTTSYSKVNRSKKSNLSLGQNFLAAELFHCRYFIKVTTDFDLFLQVYLQF